MDAEHHRAEAQLLVRRRTADDHKLLALDTLCLEPAPGARTDIFCVGLLRDHALEHGGTEFVQQLFAAALDMVREAYAPASLRQDFREARLAFSEREAAQRGAIEFQQVESKIVNDEGRRL